jgi:hypothetical protein
MCCNNSDPYAVLLPTDFQYVSASYYCSLSNIAKLVVWTTEEDKQLTISLLLLLGKT